ncbi:hypothetical protein MHPYR_200026 [uncultured Mycobacterium sp.]|uniref:Uncharacterized protein n=1 Tax=uncultured Mycobacterium sp. TaxID=171292 RepID=A0A1Y5P8S2_9MYCO|nr:hypothetical protein MHPYR_200026 [uncultured Mycobacterium sp.]
MSFPVATSKTKPRSDSRLVTNGLFHFAAQGISCIERVITDNHFSYRIQLAKRDTTIALRSNLLQL